MGRIRIKLFNLVMAELGATFLAHGISQTNAEAENLLNEMNAGFWQSIDAVFVGDLQIDPTILVEQIRCSDPKDEILFVVEFKS